MEEYIISIPHVNISLESLMSILHMEKEDDLAEDIITIQKEAEAIAKPIAIYTALAPVLHEGKIWLNGIKFDEPFVYQMLSECNYVVPYVASCGREIDEWSQSFTDVFDQFVADTLKQMCLNIIREKLFFKVKEKYYNGEGNISTINPGSLREWPITGEKPLFDLLGSVTNDIGVVLSDSLLMIPTKSASGIIFQAEQVYHNCQLCPRIDCPSRRANYAGAQSQ